MPIPGDCPACGRHTTKWVLDHDHKTDKFRGYICDSCNVAFGKFVLVERYRCDLFTLDTFEFAVGIDPES